VSRIVRQDCHTIRRGELSVCVSVIKLDSAEDAHTFTGFAAGQNCIVQLRRPGDPLITVTQDDTDEASFDGGAAGDEVLIISLHNDPMEG